MVDLNIQTSAEITRFLDPALQEDELYERLADNAGLGADEINKIAEGKMRFSVLWARQSRAVCANPIIQAYIRDPTTSDATAIAAQLLNLLIHVPGVNLVVVACLAVRIGLRKLCIEKPA